MNTWLAIAIGITIAVLYVAGTIWWIRSLIKRLAIAVAKARQGKQETQDWTILFKSVTALVAVKLVLVVIVPGSLIAATVGSMGDQYFRNKMNHWMSGPDLFEHIALTQEEYRELPVAWRQTLAEIALRPNRDELDAKRVIENLTKQDLELIGRLGPFLVAEHLARDETLQSEHPIPELNYAEMRRLEELGIIDDVNWGMEYKLKNDGDNPSTVRVPGTTVLIEARGESKTIESVLKLTRLTKAGASLLKGLRLPSNVPYFEWIARKLEADGWTVRLIALGAESGVNIDKRVTHGDIDRASVPNWATDLVRKDGKQGQG